MATTSFRPTPNRPLHLGSIWNAWANWRLARGTGGEFVLLMDDVCAEYGINWSSGYVAQDCLPMYLEDLAWFGMTPDRVEWASTNGERHRWAGQKLGYRPYQQPAGNVTWWLHTRRPAWDPNNFGDRPPIGEGPLDQFNPGFYPYYMASCLVDDHDFGITAWVAGYDLYHLSAWCIDGYERLGFSRPDIFWQDTLKVSTESEKISKTGARERSVRNYREAGYEPGRILETLCECNVRSWIAGHRNIIIPVEVLTLDGGEPQYLVWRNRTMEAIIAGEIPPDDVPEWQPSVVAEAKRRMKELTTIAV